MGRFYQAPVDTIYRQWITNQGMKEQQTSSYDIDAYFDNIGKYIVKSYRVKAERNTTVISDVINIQLKAS